MASNVSTQATTRLPAVFQKAQQDYDVSVFTEGAGVSFDVLSIRGSKFRIKSSGSEEVIVDKDGDAVAGINVIIIHANRNFSKAFYLENYVEGSDDPPDCWSMDAIRPDPSVPNRQSELCLNCPQNVRGSRITESGSKAKACADTRRTVVGIIDNDPELSRDPALLRIPTMSLRPLADYARKLHARGWPMYAVVTRLAFDHDTAYPRLTFRPVGIVEDDALAERIMDLRESDIVEQILSFGYEPPAPASEEEDDPVATQMAKTAKPAAFSRGAAEKGAAAVNRAAEVEARATPEPEPELEIEEEAEIEEPEETADTPVTNVKQAASEKEVKDLFGEEEPRSKPKPVAAKGNGKATTKAAAPATTKPKPAPKAPAQEHTPNQSVESTLDSIFGDEFNK